MKKEVATRRRRIRNAAPRRRQRVVSLYLEQKEKYEHAVKNAITDSWKDFCGKQDKEGMWEGIYRVIGRTTRREEDLPLKKDGIELDAEGSAKYLAEVFYPRDTEESDTQRHLQIRALAETVNDGGHDDHDPPFTPNELEVAAGSFNPKKAPGADGFTADICSHAIATDQGYFLALINKCLAHHYFPRTWKEATVVVLRKPGKENYSTPKSYRPIGLLPVLGKIYEKMLMGRLKFHILPRISTHQFGFMPQRSTEDALVKLTNHIRDKLKEKNLVTIVSLDIEGAFDSAWWPAIRTRLADEKCPVNLRRVIDSYLNERAVEVRYAGASHKRSTEKGCVQGSIGGPILWNLLLDPLLHQLEQLGYYCQAFADDVVLVFSGTEAREIEGQANAALEHVRAWGVNHKLKFAPHKTCAMLVTKRLKYDTPRLSMGGVDIGMTNEIKILGLTIDNRLTFNSHVTNICKRAIGIYKRLVRAARVSWGLNPEIIRTIYVAAVEPIVLYASAAWAPAAKKLGVQKQLGVVQRGFAQKMCKSYRTVSLNAALLLAGTLPLDLRVREAASLYEAKKGVPRMELGDREVERMASKMDTPHPARQAALKFGSLVDEDQYNHHSNLAVRIFTDGSKIGGKVGAAMSVWNSTEETKAHKFALSPYCTVYQAELLALCKAAEVASKSEETNFGIFSDSRAALETVINISAPHPLAVETRQHIANCVSQNKEVSLFWIKAHAGLAGNERADQLAKDAALRSKRRPEYDKCPVSFVKRTIREETLHEWDRRYRSGEVASVTKMFFPDAIEAHAILRRIKLDGILTQLLTGHGGFSSYLNRFKCKESPSCICEPEAEESVEHIILHCPVYSKCRFDLEQQLDITFSINNLPEIVKSRDRETFFNYCRKIVRIVNNRNKLG